MPFHTSDPYGDLNPWKPVQVCPVCDSADVQIGCQYQDCESCPDVESSTCRSCGANVWRGRVLATIGGSRAMSGISPVWAAECINCNQHIYTWLTGRFKEEALKGFLAHHNGLCPEAKYRLILVEPLKQEAPAQ